MNGSAKIYNKRNLIITLIFSYIASWMMANIFIPSLIIRLSSSGHHHIIRDKKCCNNHFTLHHNEHEKSYRLKNHNLEIQSFISDIVSGDDKTHHDHELCLPEYDKKFYISKVFSIDIQRGPPLNRNLFSDYKKLFN